MKLLRVLCVATLAIVTSAGMCGTPRWAIWVVNERTSEILVVIDLVDQVPVGRDMAAQAQGQVIGGAGNPRMRLDVYSSDCRLLAREHLTVRGILTVVIPEDGAVRFETSPQDVALIPTLRPGVTRAPPSEPCPVDQRNDWQGDDGADAYLHVSTGVLARERFLSAEMTQRDKRGVASSGDLTTRNALARGPRESPRLRGVVGALSGSRR